MAKKTQIEHLTGEIELDCDQLVPSVLPTQLRRQARLEKNEEKFEAGLVSLGNSIKATGGVIQAIIVRPRRDLNRDKKPVYEIGVGWRRWRASMHVGLKTIRCISRDLTDTEILEWQYDENHDREGSTPLDDADTFRHFYERKNYSVSQIADRFGKSKSEVEDLLALNDLCPEAARELEEGALPLKHAVYLAKFFSPEVQEEICKEAIAYHYNERKYGAISFKIFKEEIEEQFVRRLASAPFDTEDERLHLQGTTVAPKCSQCPQRTGYNTLFKEISQTDSCLNRACFQFKTNVNLRLKREEIAEQNAQAKEKPIEEALREVPLVTERKYVASTVPFKEKVMTEVEIYEKKECDFSILSLAVEGVKKGRKVWICENTACPVHHPPPPEKQFSGEELQQKEERFNKLVRAETRHRIMAQAVQTFDDYTTFWQFDDLIQDLIWELFFKSGAEAQNAIIRIIEDWKFPKTAQDNPAKMREWIASIDRGRQSQLLFLLTYRTEGLFPHDPTDVLAQIARDYALKDYERFAAEARLELAPDEFKEKARKHLERIRAGESARAPRFWTADAFDDLELED